MSALGLDLTLSVASIAVASMSVKILPIYGGVHLKMAKAEFAKVSTFFMNRLPSLINFVAKKSWKSKKKKKQSCQYVVSTFKTDITVFFSTSIFF